MRQRHGSLLNTYNERLRDNPNVQGKIIVKWSINQSGIVVAGEILYSELDDETFKQSILRDIKSWTFPQINIPDDLTTVTHWFAFSKDTPLRPVFSSGNSITERPTRP